jgi:hypothetical protein
MDGKELLSRVIVTVQEMYLKIGDSHGSVSLYYPYTGDPEIEKEFAKAKGGDFPGMTLEILPERLRIIVPEEDCAAISRMPARETIRDISSLVRDRAGMDAIRGFITEKYPSARIIRSEWIDFDWILIFPEDIDGDVYCLSEELGQVTYHRFSMEEYLALGFSIPGEVEEDR